MIANHYKDLFRLPFITALLLTAFLSLAACNTVEGAGEDISNAGDGLSNTAREVDNEY